MQDLLSLNPVQLDALREVANIGAGHAATALSQMTGQTIMISVPTINITPLEEVPVHVGNPVEPVAVVMMEMQGDLSGRTLLMFPLPVAVRLANLMMQRPGGGPGRETLSLLQESAIKEAGNILSAAYMNALSEFMGVTLLPSPPALAVDMAQAVLSTAYLQFGADKDLVLCVETEFVMHDGGERLRGFFLLLPELDSLRLILRAVRLD
jgi:chemotaxis protein CheC